MKISESLFDLEYTAKASPDVAEKVAQAILQPFFQKLSGAREGTETYSSVESQMPTPSKSS